MTADPWISRAIPERRARTRSGSGRAGHDREWEDNRLRIMRPEHLAVIALTVGRPKDRARLVYLVELPDFNTESFRQILTRYQLFDRWQQWASGLGLKAL